MRATLGQTSAEYAAVVAVALTIVLALAVVNGALIDMFDRVRRHRPRRRRVLGALYCAVVGGRVGAVGAAP